MGVVKRRILEDHHAGRELHVVADQLEQRAPGGAVAPPLGESRCHVLVATQGPELVRVVAIERRLVPHPPPDRMRIGVDLEVVRVVVDLGHPETPPARRGTEGWSSIVSTSTWRGCVTARTTSRATSSGVRMPRLPWASMRASRRPKEAQCSVRFCIVSGVRSQARANSLSAGRSRTLMTRTPVPSRARLSASE